MITNTARLARMARAAFLPGMIGLACWAFTGVSAQEEGDRKEAGARRERAEPQSDVAVMERRLEELKGRIRELAQAGRKDEAEAVEKEAREIARHLERIRAERRERETAQARGEGADRERRALAEHAENLERKMKELQGKEGPDAEAARRKIAEEFKAIRQRMEQMKARPEAGRPEPGREDLERRIQHLRAAAENLAAAGMEDAAHKIMQEAEAAQRNLRGAEGAREQPRPSVPPEAMQRHVEELTGVVQDLRRQVEALQRELREVRERRPVER